MLPLAESKATEDTEDAVTKLMENELKIDPPLQFHRAHRFGKEYFVKDEHGRELYKTRPIVSRFKSLNDQEQVCSAAVAL